MSAVNYKIINHSNAIFEGDKESLKLTDRTKSLLIHDKSFSLEIEFHPCFIDQIQLGLMKSAKVVISGRHKLQNNRKIMIEKVENVEKEIKAIVYHSNIFQNFKASELTNLTLNFTTRDKVPYISINYIIILKTQEPTNILSPRQKKSQKSKYEFIDHDNTRLELQTNPNHSLSNQPDTVRPLVKDKPISQLRSPEKQTFSSKPLPQPFQSASTTRPVSWDTSQFYKAGKQEERLVHTNSYAGVCSGIVIWLRVLGMNFEIYNEICDVLGIAVLEQPEELVDYFVCDKVDQEIEQLAKVFEKQVLRIEWLLECVDKKVKLGINDFLISFK